MDIDIDADNVPCVMCKRCVTMTALDQAYRTVGGYLCYMCYTPPSFERLLQKEVSTQKFTLSATCDDCSIDYRSFGLDMVFPHEQWSIISGKSDGSGLLCANCIVGRASKIEGVVSIEAKLRMRGQD